MQCDRTAMAVQTACVWEVSARKLGNVSLKHSFTDLNALDFLLSASAIAPILSQIADSPEQARIGARILAAVKATRQVVQSNTNLGIILLLTPLASVPWRKSIHSELANVLEHLTVEDADWTYQAIRIAQPSGLGEVAEQDVRDKPTVTLLQAMKLATNRDMIAQQYNLAFQDVFEFGVPAFDRAFQFWGHVEPAIIECQLHWLTNYPDSLIARKNGASTANNVCLRAAEVFSYGGIRTEVGRIKALELDRHLRNPGNRLNPGTTADLVTACLFVALRENRVSTYTPFHWNLPDWL